MNTRQTTYQRSPTERNGARSLVVAPVAQVREKPWQSALETLRIRTSMVGPVSNPPLTLIRRYEETEASIRKNRLPVRFFGYAPLFSGSLVYPGPKSDWAIMNLPDDPFYSQHNGKLYAPRAV